MSSAPLTPQEVELVETSWAKVTPIADTATTRFYDRLFELDGSLRSLFPEDLAEQKKKLAATLGFAVASLRRPDELVPAVQALGKRHKGYDVKPEHYETVGAALLWTLRQGLGDGFTSEVEQAWAKTYGVLSQTMIQAAES